MTKRECKAPKCKEKTTKCFLLHPYCEKHYIELVEYLIMMSDEYENKFTNIITKIWDRITNLLDGVLAIIEIRGYRKWKTKKDLK